MDVGVGVFMPSQWQPPTSNVAHQRSLSAFRTLLYPSSQQQLPLRRTTLYSTFRVVLHEADCFVDPRSTRAMLII